MFPSLSLWERGRVRIPAISPVYRCDSTLATTGVSEKGRRMPVQTHVVRTIFLVLCSSMLILQNGCSNSGGGNAEAPAGNANAVSLALSTPSGVPAVVADGSSTLAIRLQVTNGSGSNAGVSVTFATTAGELSQSPTVRSTSSARSECRLDDGHRADGSGSMTVTTDTNGIAQVLLTASTTAGTAVVTADALGFRTHIDIFFVPGPAARVQLNASPNTVNASGTSNLTATVTDTNGNPIPGETVTFTLSTNTSGASLSPTSGTTDSNGQVTVTYTAGATGGADTVRAQATSTSVVGSASITVTAPSGGSGSGSQPGSVASITLSADNNIIQANSSATITATLRDSNGRAVSDNVLVNFSTTLGIVSSQATTAGGNGQGKATFTAGTVAGKATVTATSGTVTASIIVTIAAGPVNSLVLRTISNTSIGVRGSGTNETSDLIFEARDSNGNLVQDPVPGNSASGTAVSFTLENGGLGGGESLSPLRATAVNGQVTTTLQSGTKAGTVKVIAFIDTNGNGLPDAGEITSLAISVVITGGPPWGENLGIVVQTLNIAGLVTAGLTDKVTVFLSDRFSNPVPDGTAVSFFSDSPSITGAAVSNSSDGTTAATATATFVSTPQVPLPPDSFAVVTASTLSGSEARVLSLAVDPFDDNVVYAGTDGGGVFRTTKGLGLRRITGEVLGTVAALPQNFRPAFPSDGNRARTVVRVNGVATMLYMFVEAQDIQLLSGAGNLGDTVSIDYDSAQVSWTQVGRAQTGLTNGIVRALQIDPATTNIIYAATDGGVFQSIGSGDAWEKQLNTPRVTALALDSTNIPNPATNRTLYAGTQRGGVFRSVNSGLSWVAINNGLSDTNVLSLVSLSSTTLYAGTFGGGVFLTFNATDTIATAVGFRSGAR